MPKLFETLPVEKDTVARIVREQWGLSLGDILKASQNHTFSATDEASGAKFAVRVTPDPDGIQHPRICDEMRFVEFLANSGLDGVCGPVRPKSAASGATDTTATPASHPAAVRDGPLTVVVFEWAKGKPVDFVAYKWMTDEAVVRAWGAWLARFHSASRAFVDAHPAVASRIRRWDEVHDCVMKGSALEASDAALDAAGLGANPTTYGILHGDPNLSNFFLVESEDEVSGGSPHTPSLSMFDWDQIQQGWFEFDIAQAALTCTMLHEGGSLPAGDPVPEADPSRFAAWILAGYTEDGGGTADVARYWRMLALRKDFYGKFVARAKAEGDIPPTMAWFIAYVDMWLSKSKGAGNT
jgi:Ser/Thr protein kinase RdoA (MazF antagonist)